MKRGSPRRDWSLTHAKVASEEDRTRVGAIVEDQSLLTLDDADTLTRVLDRLESLTAELADYGPHCLEQSMELHALTTQVEGQAVALARADELIGLYAKHQETLDAGEVADDAPLTRAAAKYVLARASLTPKEDDRG